MFEINFKSFPSSQEADFVLIGSTKPAHLFGNVVIEVLGEYSENKFIGTSATGSVGKGKNDLE